MNTLPEDIQNTIYKYKHQMEFNHVVNEMHGIVTYWCINQLHNMYCESGRLFLNNFDCLNDCEEHLCYDIHADDILVMMRVWNAI